VKGWAYNIYGVCFVHDEFLTVTVEFTARRLKVLVLVKMLPITFAFNTNYLLNGFLNARTDFGSLYKWY